MSCRGGGSRTLVGRLLCACSSVELRLRTGAAAGGESRICAQWVPSSGIEPASPALQAGAITRSATRASLWPGWCPATGIVNYSIVRERVRCATTVVRGRGIEPRSTGSKPAGLPLADPRGVICFRSGTAWAGGESNPVRSGKSRVLRRQSFWPRCSFRLPPVGLEPTHAGLKGRCPTRWATTANDRRRRVCDVGAAGLEPAMGAAAQTGLQPVSFAARMHAPRSRSRDSFPVA